MKKTTLLFLTIIIMITACKTKKEEVLNPLLAEFDTPFQVPPFDKIKNEHFMPAFEEAMKAHTLEIEKIANNEDAPTFANTIEALDYSGSLLMRVSSIFFNLNEANTNDSIQAIAQEVSPKLSEHSDNITLNKPLFERIKAVYNQKSELNLNTEQSILLEETYKRFVRGGANLDAQKQIRFREINTELSTLSLQFGENVLAENNSFKMFIENESDLAGLPQGVKDAASEAAKAEGKEGQWLFTLHNPSVMPFLQYSENRELRQKMLLAFTNKGNNGNEFDNKEIIKKIVNLRIERANLLGYATHADFILEENMAKNSEAVYNLLNQIWPSGLNVAKKEAADLQALINKENQRFKLEAWDWSYYTEKLRKEKYDIDEEQLRAYFELESVKQGIFTLCEKLYGIKFKLNSEIPVYHPDVLAYEVLEADDSFIGILYMDFHPRESKRGGAWMTSYRDQSIRDGQFIHPVISIVCNFTSPTANQPSLLTLDEVETFFHEFGHALHGLLSKCTYISLSGTSVSRDFVELPSQIMENWVIQPEMLKLYAKHYQTGELIPEELVEKIKAAAYFNQGFATTEFLASAYLDMAYHTLTEPLDTSAVDFENKIRNEIGLIPEIPFRHRSTYFQHIFSGGYSSGYYSYTWSEVLDADAFELFKEKGIFDRATAESFRKNILEKGKTDNEMELYKRFRGSEPSIEPLLRNRGLIN
ncbi:MAG: M3 family metallopeptidase [Bacteroidales bacterium]|nr:M3 family metallopeptidase [Bacteroidales bacterium]